MIWAKYDPDTGEIIGWVDSKHPPIIPPPDVPMPEGTAPSPQAYVEVKDAVPPSSEEAYVVDGKIKKYTAAQKKAKKERPFGTKWDNKTHKHIDDRTPGEKARDEEREVRYARKAEYPRLEELADAIYWESKGDKTKMKEYLAKVEAVKVKHPKKDEKI